MISDKLKSLILRELNLSDFDIKEDTLAKDVPGWDSLKNFTIVLAIEEEFAIKFLTEEILSIKNVGDLQKLIDSKTNNKG
jgi:acyl carrier protein